MASPNLPLPAALAANDDELRARPWNSRHFVIPDHLSEYPTMMTAEEVRMLAYLGRYACLPRGKVYDLGPFLGGSTYPLAWGVMQRGLREAVVSIDQFRASERQKERFIYSKGIAAFDGEDIFPLFKSLTDGLPVEAHRSNVCDFTPSDEISLLFVDVCKTPATNFHVVNQFISKVAFGGIIVQQDFLSFGTPWIIWSMYKLKRYFSVVGLCDYNSVIFRVIRPLSPHDIKDCLWTKRAEGEMDVAFDWALSIGADYRHWEAVELARSAYHRNPSAPTEWAYLKNPPPPLTFECVFAAYRRAVARRAGGVLN